MERGCGVALDKARQGESGTWTTYNLLPFHPGLVLDQVQDMWTTFETGKGKDSVDTQTVIKKGMTRKLHLIVGGNRTERVTLA